MLCYVMKRMARYVMNGLWSKRRQTKTANVKMATEREQQRSILATLTYILIILLITSPLSFCLFFPPLTLLNFPTHNKNHILDLVITSSDCSLAPSLSSSHCSPSDHFPVFTRLSIDPIPLPPPTLHSFRRLHSIDIGSFLTYLKQEGQHPLTGQRAPPISGGT